MTTFRFPEETVEFLTDLRAHNDKAWFDPNRARYESGYLEPAKEFVELIGAALAKLVPGIHAEPSVGKGLDSNGFLLRYRHDVDTDVDGLPGSEGAFLACSFWYADALDGIGRHDEACALGSTGYRSPNSRSCAPWHCPGRRRWRRRTRPRPRPAAAGPHRGADRVRRNPQHRLTPGAAVNGSGFKVSSRR